MIPVTSFAGKTVAVFGLGGSGLASCHALKAGGADVVASDDGAERLAEAARAGFATSDLRSENWSRFAALILTPGAPLTHPAPHWSVLMARQAGVEVIGGLFVLEAVSVIVQVTSFKLTGKRIFKMAPIHHHFEQLGWTEPQIVIRFWIISVMLALAGLSTLKLR